MMTQNHPAQTTTVVKTLGAIACVLIIAGCNAPVVPPVASPQMEILEEDQGWVQVRVTGVSSSGYELWWGDVDSAYGVSSVFARETLYEHFYQAVLGPRSGEQTPTWYEISLRDPSGQIVAQQSIKIGYVDCHLSLVRVEGRSVTVRYWGRFGIQYSISWGDHQADHVIVSTQNASGLASHAYADAGTYTLGMEEIWAPTQTFFSVTVD